MPLTDDPNDPDLQVVDEDGMQKSYLVLSDEERAKGFIRPVRTKYVHVGAPTPKYPLREVTVEERQRFAGIDYVMYEEYPEGDGVVGRYYTARQMARIGHGCQSVTTMALPLAETYARQPGFYGGTFCAHCGAHFPVGKDGEFVWDGTDERVGT